MTRATAEERLLARSVRDGTCLRWTGTRGPTGYGTISVSGRKRRVHRVAHELWVGPIPEGYDVDHVKARGCRFRDCIEPEHLEAVTHRENLLRSDGLSGRRANPDQCRRGHPYTPDNLVWRKDGHRQCRRCTADYPRPARECPECGKRISYNNLNRHVRNMHPDERN